MKVTFVAMGTENISLEVLSAFLKKHGHRVNLAFDQALFDDKNYLTIPFLAKIFDHKESVVKKIITSKPDLVGFSVFTANYQWALKMARRVKARLDVPVIFGGIHPTCLPEMVIKEKEVDIVCIGEGEYPLLELLESMKKGKINYRIKNLWFKRGARLIKNPVRSLINNLDSFPYPDKSLFDKEVPIKYCYLAVTAKGCPYNCSYCSQNFLKRFEKKHGPVYRERSVDNVIGELKLMKKKYNYDWVDLKNNIISANKEWTLDFLKRYKEEIRVPIRVFAHPLTMDEDIARALKAANCWRVQIGIQSMNEEIRRRYLFRFETNEDIKKAFQAMDKYNLHYSIDHIFGLPGETEQDLIEACREYSRCTSCVRITPFWLGFLPKTDMIKIALKKKMIKKKDLKWINLGKDEHYIIRGSIKDKEKINIYQSYHLLMRVIPIMPVWLVDFILNYKLQRYFRFLPRRLLILVVDFFVSFRIKDYTSLVYMKTYFWEFIRRFRKN